MVTIRYTGDEPLPLFGKVILPGERREVGEKQWEQVQEMYPGMFSAGGRPAPEEPAAKVEEPPAIDERLTGIRGIGERTAAMLGAVGIGSLESLAALGGWELTVKAAQLPGVSESKLHTWAEQAREVLQAEE
jgi:predicted flap endonuclease-1-like 5' DNA nuclease